MRGPARRAGFRPCSSPSSGCFVAEHALLPWGAAGHDLARQVLPPLAHALTAAALWWRAGRGAGGLGLRALDCSLGQGWLFARPLPAADATDLLLAELAA